MSENEKILKILEKFFKHYDELDTKAWKQHKENDYACAMAIACISLKRSLKNNMDSDAFEIIAEKKHRHEELIVIYTNYNRSKKEIARQIMSVKSWEVLKKRLKTALRKA